MFRLHSSKKSFHWDKTLQAVPWLYIINLKCLYVLVQRSHNYFVGVISFPGAQSQLGP